MLNVATLSVSKNTWNMESSYVIITAVGQDVLNACEVPLVSSSIWRYVLHAVRVHRLALRSVSAHLEELPC